MDVDNMQVLAGPKGLKPGDELTVSPFPSYFVIQATALTTTTVLLSFHRMGNGAAL